MGRGNSAIILPVRALKILSVVGLIAAGLAGLGLFLLDRYVQSEAFRALVRSAAHDALGSEVGIGDLRVSVLSGATLERVTVANPSGLPGNLLAADALVIRYRLLSLFRKRLEVTRVALDRPVLRLVRGEKGAWSYERPAARPLPAPTRGGSSPLADPAPSSRGAAPGLDVVIPEVTVSRGDIVVTGHGDRLLARAEGLDLTGAVSWVGGALGGSGTARIETLDIGDALFVRRLSAPVRFSAGEVRLAPLQATVADGEVRGDLTLRLAGGAHYAATLEVRDADVERLLREAGARRRLARGKLQVKGALEGSGGFATLAGTGHAEIRGGALLDMPILNLLGTLLRVPALRDLQFEECRVELTLADGVLRTPVIRVIARDVQITGRGAISLATATLDHDLTLALPKAVIDRAPNEVRAAFTERPDGWRAVDFRVWGPYDAPKTDLQDKVLRGVAEGLLGRGLRKLFK